MSTYPKPAESELEGLDPADVRRAEIEHSLACRIGRGVEPAVRPLGFDWRIATALVPTFAAKEAFVTQMGIVFGIADEDGGEEQHMKGLQKRLRSAYAPLVGFAVIIFCLLTVPCMATVAVTWRESHSWRWALLQVVGYTAVAYVATLLVYQGGRLLGLGT